MFAANKEVIGFHRRHGFVDRKKSRVDEELELLRLMMS
jgi:hypothetical protein